MSSKAFVGARIFDGAGWHDGKVLVTGDGRVGDIADRMSVPPDADIIDAEGLLIAPGFIDLQVNGGGGVMFNNEPDVEGIARICSAHAQFGTTALMVTLITDRPDITSRAAEAGIAAHKAGVRGFLGLHFEGPHLSVARKGTHDPALIRKMETADLAILTGCKAKLPFVLTTIAPENVTEEQVTALRKAGIVVSLGHTDAGLSVATAYAEAGASMVTHLFNAMSPLGHREPGLVGAALSNGKLDCGLIADGFHVDPAAIGIALRAKNSPGRIFLVTDAMSTIGTDDDGFELNGRRVYRNGGRLTLEDGTLAGADIDMLSCVRFMHEKLDTPLEEALRMASAYPAEAVGASGKGKLLPGFDADFVMLTPDLQMHSTWISGEKIHDAARSGA
ncbi:N-acetylglucosamine-6-phosphate deacetylase [Agrobacterium tumefaciens]|uniref:N-acetylglucosamine-6-phosphate deacetylase n=1 Tax=Agrobacterium tumefaciens TaxID=358 RepID=UPI000EF2793D|nr:N-acetylglucosamine-6-phosphate deacetylase [Agrobacterium tumefaciens]AYM06504.1 N-acetylglucosamine-6-phosphate deacetylase [Agrobacterium tumefaciens]NSZ33521.1 N-acetylglucosamine-6-phosphate deacetylase [Agrobacterium tumefaciens]QLG22891.1 N-acetylglucosamine-6-phosphate deacetylase [Agrobacterium tumefaciens]UXS86775.1 N-acetylglucosamine-6-phosphate deacetylase [Agrobacterium tumefaciens]